MVAGARLESSPIQAERIACEMAKLWRPSTLIDALIPIYADLSLPFARIRAKPATTGDRPTRTVCMLAAVACLIVAPPALAATAADAGPRWSLGGDERDPYLVFGDESMGETTVILICNNRKKTAELSVSDASKDAKTGRNVTIELSGGGHKASFAGKTVRSAGIFGYARKIDFDTVANMLRAPGVVTVTMGSNRYVLHDRGRAQAVVELKKSCKFK
jgi:hypothetical protein